MDDLLSYLFGRFASTE